jgi:hypothetical protein
VARRQSERFADRDARIYADREEAYQQLEPQNQTQPSGGEGESGTIQQLKDLAELKAQGVLSDEEFATEKAKILGG